MNKRDFNKRITNITNSAQYNELVNQYMQKHYQQLYCKLVKSEIDKDLFQNTYLLLTVNYKNPSVNFIDEFQRQFYNLKLEQQKKQIITIELNANTEKTTETEIDFI